MVSSVYIHIPFCSSICTYCDFAKLYYNSKWVNEYLDSLEKEIKKNYKNETLKTLYIGGGTPSSLNIDELKRLFKILSIFKLDNDYEYTIECNIENLTKEKAILFKQNKVNRISIGVQTFNSKYLKFLGRNHTKEEVIEKIEILKELGFENINIDLMYAFPGETLEELNNDIDEYLKLNINHISTYSLIIEPHTIIYNKGIKNIDEDLDADMYNLISNKLSNYHHYEISNFAQKGYESKHNLVYWNNEEYYGFGLGASGYLNNIRYTNTSNLDKYNKGIYIDEEHTLDINETIENEFILGLRKLDGINKKEFNKKYNIDINKLEIVKKLIQENRLIDNSINIYINYDMIYISNSILCEFIGGNYGKI